MNFIYHAATGMTLDVTLGTFPIMTAASVLPDYPMIFNEIRLWWRREKFSPATVPDWIASIYFSTHSLIAIPFVAMISKEAALAWFIHQFFDWFTHTGRFSTKPFYPISNWSIPFGKEILK